MNKDLRIVKKLEPSEAELQRQAVQRLVSSVKDETHWQQILSSAETDAQREELERVVGPMLKFRRAAPCTTPECESGEPGVYQPVLVVASPIAPDEPSYVPIELRLCERCKGDARLQDFLTESIWQQIIAQTEGMPPVRRLTTLKWDRIH